MVSAFTTDLFNSAFEKFTYTGNFGQFKTQRYILFNVSAPSVMIWLGLVTVQFKGGVYEVGLLTCRSTLQATEWLSNNAHQRQHAHHMHTSTAACCFVFEIPSMAK